MFLGRLAFLAKLLKTQSIFFLPDYASMHGETKLNDHDISLFVVATIGCLGSLLPAPFVQLRSHRLLQTCMCLDTMLDWLLSMSSLFLPLNHL